MSRVVALDHGAARCGVASSDPSGTIVSPLDPVERPDSGVGMSQLSDLITRLDAATVVVGLPLGLDGEPTAQSGRARAFAGRLAALVPEVEVELFDERLTTKAAQEIGGSSSEDSRAAAVLLERWLLTRGTK
ncbi:MAG: Holliday junction resolvase RuvX [Actinomycetes bacterium]